jgi:hypothetical protein
MVLTRTSSESSKHILNSSSYDILISPHFHIRSSSYSETIKNSAASEIEKRAILLDIKTSKKVNKRSKYYKKYAKNYAKATMEGWEWAFENKEEAIDIVINFQKEAQVGTNRAAQRWMLDRMEDVFLIKEGKRQLGVLREEDFNSTVELLREYKDFKSAIKYEEFYKGGGK